ncbi:MAG: MFS transporter [Anaerolineae bacterium]|nr:MFS transporter [Anaerolineae bacterium]
MAEKFSVSSPIGRRVLFSTILASSMAFIDGSALNVALNALQLDLNAGGADLIWIVNAYLLFLAALILIGGSLGDQFGRVRIFRIGIIVFTLASLACGLAPSTTLLILARAVQGVGAALMVPGSLAIISALIVDGERGRAIGIWSAASTITTIAGPVVGGLFVDNLTWRAVFFINLPLALLALYSLTDVPENRNEAAGTRRIDIPGALLVTLGLAGLTYGLVSLGENQAGTSIESLTLFALVGGVLALIAFVVVEARSAHPMVDLQVFRSRTFSGANVMTAFLYGALGGALLFLPLNLIQVQGYLAANAGLTIMPFGLVLALLSPWAGRLIDRYGPRLPLTVGPFIVGCGFLMLALPGLTAGIGDYWVTYFPAMVTLGAGMGITVAPLTTAVMTSVPSSQSGIASGINNAVTRSAQVLATAIFGAVALVMFSNALAGQSVGLALPAATQQALLAGARELGNTPIPTGLAAGTADAAQMAVKLAFVDMFRLIMVIAAGMAWLSALLAALIIAPGKSTDRIETPIIID